MSEPIMLTERERAVFEALAVYLRRGSIIPITLTASDLADTVLRWLSETPAESASPPRVPGASAHPLKVGVESGPGQPIEYTTAREQDRAEGYRAGIEAAAGWHDQQAAEWDAHDSPEAAARSKMHSDHAAAIRALADKPAPDAALSRLRADGWMVAVHNDYRLNGEWMTFWLLARDNVCVKGEGRSDEEALLQIDEQIAAREGG